MDQAIVYVKMVIMMIILTNFAKLAIFRIYILILNNK